ncbi:hypothetical protein [Microbulbifer sp. HZ11]|uniref:hypothetical protein n=1 Tax=unclassified Microbulbifer TaxID=2619833 RepID=UPI0005BD386E|nr:hypothetical protein [Microbulbifer sp. HZ11]
MSSSKDRANGHSDQGKLIAGTREVMSRRDESIDGETLSRLRRARSAALDARPGLRPRTGLWLPASLASTAAAVAVVLLLEQYHASQAKEVDFLADAWILDEEAELELIEDVEFYQWLAEEELDG